MLYLLRSFGHRVKGVLTGQEGMDAALRDPPDVIVCDVMLPDVHGTKVVKRLREQPATEAVPIVAVTALAMDGDRERLLQAGFDGYLSKPIVPETFVATIETFARD